MLSIFIAFLALHTSNALVGPWRAFGRKVVSVTSMSLDNGAKLRGIAIDVPDPEAYAIFYSKNFQVPHNPTTGSLSLISGATIRVNQWENGQMGEEFEVGEGFYGVGLATPLAQFLADNAASQGVVFHRKFGDYSYGASSVPDEDEMKQYPVRYGLTKDPAGFVVEIKEDVEVPIDSYCKITIKVLDLEQAVDFYGKVLGLQLLRRRANVNNRPKEATGSAFLGISSEKEGAVLELLYKYATETLDLGNCFQELVFELPCSSETFQSHLKSINQAFEVLPQGDVVLKDPAGYRIRVHCLGTQP
eukprot:gene35458-42980_t